MSYCFAVVRTKRLVRCTEADVICVECLSEPELRSFRQGERGLECRKIDNYGTGIPVLTDCPRRITEHAAGFRKAAGLNYVFRFAGLSTKPSGMDKLPTQSGRFARPLFAPRMIIGVPELSW